MSGPVSNARGDPIWVEGLRREMQRVIGHMLRLECKLPQELVPELSVLLSRIDEQPFNSLQSQ
jgi:hypothetical protein